MKRRLAQILLLSCLLVAGGDVLWAPFVPHAGLALADDGGSDGGDGHGSDGHDSDGGSDGHESDGGSDHGGSDNGGSDNGGSDNGGSGGSSSGGSSGSSGSSGGSSGSGSNTGGSDNSHDSGESEGSADNGQARHLFAGEGLRVIYGDGSSERIVRDAYERIDRRGQIVERRTASSAEHSRLRSLTRGLTSGRAPTNLVSAVTINAARKKVEITDKAGWHEVLERGRYTLTDPNGNVVTRRTATAKDIRRISAFVGER